MPFTDFASQVSRVRDAYVENFRQEDEVGSAFSVVKDGEAVVDLWGGWKDAACTVPWERDTIVCMMSVVKGLCGITFNTLIDRGLVDPDAPVARYWPEFAQNGKAELPVRFVLDHRAGLPVVTAPLPRGAMFDREAMTNALAAQAPLWPPGTQAGYHIHTQGFLLSEITRRVTGKTLARFFRDEVALPLHVDYQIGGLSAADQLRCAELQPVLEGTLFAVKDKQPATLLGQAFAQNPDEPWPVTLNSKAWREAEICSANGHWKCPSSCADIQRGRSRRRGRWGSSTIFCRHRSDAYRATQHDRGDAAAPLSSGPWSAAQYA